MTRQERIVHELASPGSLFLVLTLPELRRQGMTYLSLYALLRTIERASDRSGDCYSESWLRSETGLEDYETSRACRLLAKGGLVTASKAKEDGRIRELKPTERGRRILDRIISEAGRRLWTGIHHPGRIRRLKEATAHLRKANRILHGPFQLSFFDRDLSLKDGTQGPRKRSRVQPSKTRSQAS